MHRSQGNPPEQPCLIDAHREQTIGLFVLSEGIATISGYQ
jgi:hypothetical protein